METKSLSWFHLLTRRGSLIFPWLEKASVVKPKLQEFTGLAIEDVAIYIIKKEKVSIFLEKNNYIKITEVFKKTLIQSPDFLERVTGKLNARLQDFEKFSTRKRNLHKLKNKDLADLCLSYARYYTSIGSFYTVYYGIEPILKKEVEEWLKSKIPPERIPEYYNILTFPPKLPYLAEEDQVFLRIVQKIISQEKIKNYFITNKTEVILKNLPRIYPDLEKETLNHLRKYYWVPVERDAPRWKKEDIIERLKFRIKNPPQQISLGEKFIKKRNHYEKKLKIPSDILKRIKELRDLLGAVDAMKRTYAISHAFLPDLFEQIASRLGLRKEDCYFLTPLEIVDLLKSSRKSKRGTIVRRKGECLVIQTDPKKPWFVDLIEGKQAAKIAKKLFAQRIKIPKGIDALTGVVASPGKTRGIVRVLLNADEVGKLNRGEVLVTPMTTPDYIVAVQKASAIVTDEGGILCHAAIISREFGIPCVIDTKIATRILKDGDFIEVNAEKGIGIVKKIKKAE